MRTFRKWPTNQLKTRPSWQKFSTPLAIALLISYFMGCAGNLQSKIASNLSKISRQMTIAILPVETNGEDEQDDAAQLFRQSLYASLEQSQFKVMERYLVDALLERNNIAQPKRFKALSPIRLGEILGADAVLLITLNKMVRTYAVVHSSIELGVSIKMMDTRTGEILWMADQAETEYDGIAKIPTGITAAVFAPVQLITNKVNLHRLTQKMTEKLTGLVKKPESARPDEKFNSPIVVASASKEIQTLSYVKKDAPTQAQKAPTQVSPPTQPKKSDNLFTIQVGAYKFRGNAVQMISALMAKGYKAFLFPMQTDGKTLYKVQIEKFKSRAKALKYGRELARREHLHHFITKFQPS